MSCAYCKRKRFQLKSLSKDLLTAKFITSRYRHIKITDKICLRCHASAENARLKHEKLIKNNKINTEPIIQSITTDTIGSLLSNDDGLTIHDDTIDEIVYQIPRHQESQDNARSIYEDPEIGGTIGVRVYEAWKNRSKIVDENCTPNASKTSNERRRTNARIDEFVPSSNEVQPVLLEDNSRKNKSNFPNSSNGDTVLPSQFKSPASKIAENLKKDKKIMKPMPKSVKLKKMKALELQSKENVHSSQEAGPSGVRKKITKPLVFDSSDYSDDSFPDIQSLEPADSLVHTRPIIPRRKQDVIFSNKDQMDVYLERHNFGG